LIKAYWIKHSISAFWISKDPHDHWGKTGWSAPLETLKKQFPGMCFFSDGVIVNTFQRIWIYSPGLRDQFKTAKDREQYCFWINPLWLEELVLDD